MGDIVPFRCAKCGQEFLVERGEGGLCRSCKLPFCLLHLHLPEGPALESAVCQDCNRIGNEKLRGAIDVRFDFDHNFEVEADVESPGRPELGPPVVCFPREADTGRLLKVIPHNSTPWLGVFAGGYPSPPALYFAGSCPDPNRLCVVSNGAGYVVRADAPDDWGKVPVFPVLESRALLDQRILLFLDHTRICAYGPEGLKWRTPRLSSDGLRILELHGHQIRLLAYYAPEQRDFEVVADLATGTATPQLF